jgi:cystathionine beta-lyase/cystathionine gamma-synthase
MLCFASGMAAISAVMLGTAARGDHMLFVNQTYGPTLQLAEHLRRFGIEHDVVLDVGTVRRAVRSARTHG